jgi:hypothetical protein
MQETFADYPEAEIRAILGESAVNAYGFDPEVLLPVAEKVGPTLSEITGSGRPSEG